MVSLVGRVFFSCVSVFFSLALSKLAISPMSGLSAIFLQLVDSRSELALQEKRRRDQVIKQKEEEAQKKKSDLEIELLKRQQKLEQLELEKQKLQEEQENAPEFVKVKGNLRRTGQEVAQAQES